MRKNRNKGFTLIEVVVAIGLIAIFSGFVLASLSAVSQARIKSTANIIQSEFRLTQDFAQTHGSEAEFWIQKTEEGIVIMRTGDNLKTEVTEITDGTEIFYKLTSGATIYQLGKDTVLDRNGFKEIKITDTLKMSFTQTEGQMHGPHPVDWIIVSNGNKSYKLYIVHETGQIYFDYNVDSNTLIENIQPEPLDPVPMPSFMTNGLKTHTVTMKYTGETLQPEIIYDPTYIRIGGVYRAVERGEYQISFVLKNPYTTQWEAHVPENAKGQEEYLLTWVIE